MNTLAVLEKINVFQGNNSSRQPRARLGGDSGALFLFLNVNFNVEWEKFPKSLMTHFSHFYWNCDAIILLLSETAVQLHSNKPVILINKPGTLL